MLKLIGAAAIMSACLFDLASWYRQIRKTLRTKKSAQVSSMAYVMKMGHYMSSLTALTIFHNWVGFGMEFLAFTFCVITLSIVIKYKPKGWKF